MANKDANYQIRRNWCDIKVVPKWKCSKYYNSSLVLNKFYPAKSFPEYRKSTEVLWIV